MYSQNAADAPVIKLGTDITELSKLRIELIANNLTEIAKNDDTNFIIKFEDIPDTLIGDVELAVYYDNAKIHSFTDFKVKANIIDEIKKVGDKDKVFESGTSYGIQEVYNLKKYQDVVYGQYDETSEKCYLYHIDEDKDGILDNLIDLTTTDYNNLSIAIAASADTDPTLTWGDDDKLNIGFMREMDAKKTRTIYLMQGTSVIVSTREITIKNKNSFATLATDLSFNALKEYASDEYFKVNGFTVESIVADNLTFELKTIENNGSPYQVFKLKDSIKDIFDADVTITFTDETNELVYHTTFTIKPYLPKEDVPVNVYSGAMYDLYKGLYDESAVESDENINSLLITGIENDKGEDITSEVIQGVFNQSGYIKDMGAGLCEVTFNEISGESLTVKVKYQIRYSTGLIFEDTRDLTIVNRQKIEISYPETGLDFGSRTINFKQGFEDDGAYLSGKKVNDDGIYEFTSSTKIDGKTINFETLVIFTDASQVLNFANDDVKIIKRAQVENYVTNNVDTSNNLIIELIGYQKNPGMEELGVTYNTNEVVFAPAIQGTAGMMVFKLTTVSGYFDYYFVYVCCAGESTRINEENNLKVVAYSNNYNLPKDKEDICYLSLTDNKISTYRDLLNYIGNKDNNQYKVLYKNTTGDVTFYNLFGVEYSATTTSAYLYESKYAGETDSNPFNYIILGAENEDIDTKNKKVDDVNIVVNDQFNTITIGLMLTNGVNQYFYGTITIYVQPNITLELENNNLTCNVPNGEFEGSIPCVGGTVYSPFKNTTNGNWNAEIVSVGGIEYEKLSDEQKEKYTYSGSTITINERVEEDTIIRVKYTLKQGDTEKTIAFVNYTYLKTELPTENFYVNVGEFSETSGFNNNVILGTANDYNSQFFNTYAGNYTLELIDSDTYKDRVEFNGTGYENASNTNVKTITFKQTTEVQNIRIKFIYLDFSGVDNEKTFTFVVKAGISYAETNDTNNGTSSSKRITTDGKKDYLSSVGSTIDFYATKYEKYYKYQIGGLIIYTNDAIKVDLTFDAYNFVIKDDSVLKIDENYPLNFVFNEITSSDATGEPTYPTDDKQIKFTHSATDTPVTMTIKILDSNGTNSYGTRNFYLSVIQTYTGLRAKYLVDGADHENVASLDANQNSNSINDLHTEFFGSNRFTLLGDYDTSIEDYVEITGAQLSAMGFTTQGNPNYIDFSVGQNAIIKSFVTDTKTVGIVFNNVSENTLCYVYLNNNAGMEKDSVTYTYQIVPGTKADGLNYVSNNGMLVGTLIETTDKETGETIKKTGDVDYISYLLEDTDASKAFTSKTFVIGSMLDERNTNIFNVSISKEFYTGNVSNFKTIGVSDKKIDEGDSDDGIKSIYYEFKISEDNASYDAIISYDVVKNLITLQMERTNGETKLKGNIVLSLNIAGVNGFIKTDPGSSAVATASVVSNLKIVISNYSINSQYEDSIDSSIYGGDIIDLNDKISGIESDEITLEFNEIAYQVLGASKTETYYDEKNNNVVIYDIDAKRLSFEQVGKQVSATIRFIAQANSYNLKAVEYKFVVNVNYQFVANGDTYVEYYEDGKYAVNAGQTSLETTFALTTDIDTSDDKGTFPIEVEFISKEKFNTNDEGIYKGLNNCFNSLVVDLYYITNYADNTSTESDWLAPRDIIEITNYSNLINTGISITQRENDGISIMTFNKDYTGDIELLLKVNSDVGNYEVVWTIHVQGIRTLNYTSAEPDLAVLQNNALPFNSNETYNIIDTSRSTGVGLVMNSADIATNNVDISYSYEYVINTYNSETYARTNKDRFNFNDGSGVDIYYQGGGTDEKTSQDNYFEIRLPSVPTTDDDIMQSYLVTYKITVEYLRTQNGTDDDGEISYKDNNIHTFYVTYQVVNRQYIKPNNTDISINDENEVNVIYDVANGNGFGKYYLDLFFYETKFETTEKVDTVDTKFTYTFALQPQPEQASTAEEGEEAVDDPYEFEKNNFVLIKNKVDTDTTTYICTYKLVSVNNYQYTFKCDENDDTIVYDASNNELFRSSNKIDVTWLDVTQETENTVFTAGFTNIVNYINFIKPYLIVENKNKTYISIGNDDNRKFTLVHIGDGHYGIDLAENLDENNKILFENELVDSLNLYENGVCTVSIPAYVAETATGFRIRTTDTIVAATNNGNGVKLSSMFILTYFEKNKDPIAFNSAIIGIGEPKDEWVKGGKVSTTEIDNNVYATIRIPSYKANGTTYYNEYVIKKVTYYGINVATGSVVQTAETGTPTTPIYNLVQSFFYLCEKESDTTQEEETITTNFSVVVPNYSAVGGATTYFKVSYNRYLDLSKAFVEWTMVENSGGLLELTKSTDFSPSISITNDGIDCVVDENFKTVLDSLDESILSNYGRSPYFEDGKIKMDKDTLDLYKRVNPNNKNYPMASATINVNGKNYLCDVMFSLSNYPTIETDTSSLNTSHYKLDLIISADDEALYVPNGSTSKKLTNEDILYVEEIETSGYLVDYADGSLTLDADYIANYFDSYSTSLTITFEITLANKDTLTFQVIIDKSITKL